MGGREGGGRRWLAQWLSGGVSVARVRPGGGRMGLVAGNGELYYDSLQVNNALPTPWPTAMTATLIGELVHNGAVSVC